MNTLRELRASAVNNSGCCQDGDNLLTKTVTAAGQSPVTTTYTVNDANELLTQSDGATNISYTYDAAGRQASKTDGTYTTINSWRFADMLYKVESDDPAVPDVTYEYGGNGLKRSRETDTEYDWYNWSGLQLIQAEDAQGALTDTYVHHPFRIWGSALADISGSAPGTGTARFFTHDMLGSTRGVWDGSKTLIGAWEPTPFGETYTSTLPSDVLHQFTGQVYDPVTELNYFAFRHYGPSQSRWLSQEPLGLDGPNFYWYGGNNPTSNVDRDGLFIVGAIAVGVAVYGLGKMAIWHYKRDALGKEMLRAQEIAKQRRAIDPSYDPNGYQNLGEQFQNGNIPGMLRDGVVPLVGGAAAACGAAASRR